MRIDGGSLQSLGWLPRSLIYNIGPEQLLRRHNAECRAHLDKPEGLFVAKMNHPSHWKTLEMFLRRIGGNIALEVRLGKQSSFVGSVRVRLVPALWVKGSESVSLVLVDRGALSQFESRNRHILCRTSHNEDSQVSVRRI